MLVAKYRSRLRPKNFYELSRRCEVCNGVMFDARSSPRVTCSIACRTIRQERPTAVCRRCGVEKKRDQFIRLACGSRAKTCSVCNPTPQKRLKRKGPQPAPNPCKFCKGTVYCKGPPSRAKERKFCSRACVVEYRNAHYTCSRCSEKKPVKDFGQTAKGYRQMACKACVEKGCISINGRVYFKQSPVYVFKFNRTVATRNGLPFTLTLDWVRAALQQPCAMCGDSASRLMPAAKHRGFTPQNTRQACEPCAQLLRVLSAARLIKLATRIAARAGKA